MSQLRRIGNSYYNLAQIKRIHVVPIRNKYHVEVYGLKPHYPNIAMFFGSGGRLGYTEEAITWKFKKEQEAHDFVAKHF